MATVTGTDESERLDGADGVTGLADSIFGYAGDDTIDAGDGDDTIYGGAGADRMEGGGGYDWVSYLLSTAVVVNMASYGGATGGEAQGDNLFSIEGLIGSSYADTITGDSSDNTVKAGRGADSVDGSYGADTLYGENDNDTLIGGLGLDRLYGGAGNDYLGGGDDIDILEGGDGNDTINAGAGNDHIGYSAAEGVGDDLMRGDAGNDYIYDNSGRNTLDGGEGEDTLQGGADADRLDGGTENDTLGAAAGADTIFGGSGDDYISAGAGGDSIDGGDGFDKLYFFYSAAGVMVDLATGVGSGGDAEGDVYAGVEFVWATNFDDSLVGDGEDNELYSAAGADTIDGGGGADTIGGGAGADRLTGGSGTDLLTYFDTYESVRINLATNAVSGGAAQSDVISGFENVTGADSDLDQGGDDTLTGAPGSNVITGLGGDDLIDGGAGDDTLIGDEGFSGFYGEDTFKGGAGFDLMDGGGGVDTVDYSASGAAVEINLGVGAGTGGDAAGDQLRFIENAIGSGKADKLTGSADANLLDGRAGADTLTGGLGDDDYYIDNASDHAIEKDGEGNDRVVSAISYSLAGEYIERLRLTGSGDIDATGNSLNNTIAGNSGDNLIDGGKGADAMAGAKGDDDYVVQSAGDTAVELDGQGDDRVLSSVSYSLAGQFIERLRLTGDGDVNGTGNTLANKIAGNSGDNVLDGGKGADQISGGSGHDTFVFANALGASNVDTIIDFKAADDTIRLENAVFTGLSAGALAASAFYAGTAAHDSSDRIIYNASTGALLFDRDGAGATYAAVKFATLENHSTITNADFVLV
ncbi:calcium-binding protein [Hansschlegelia plantiphila]|uniref:Calcium-binding protein n=1 Tax=Hansschlegelia plantiphila TaxID=374655 RepID=A0A9W6J4B1_9HYPH|nr:calcium-binding protein [Hansschlegelia plantiphila]GLK69109.1 hypothetical protein GCM10008179_27470 [Hansschlegelia plantiphila]